MDFPITQIECTQNQNGSHSVHNGPKALVLQTPELLAIILFHLDNCTLLLAQRVSRTFHALIATPRLQRKLFFRPSVDPPGPFAPLVTYSADEHGHNDPRHVRHVRLNPVLVSTFPNFFPRSPIGDDRSAFERLPWAAGSRAAVLREGASWRRMLLCEPQPVACSFTFSRSSGWARSVRSVDMMAGGDGVVRMGPVYDLVENVAVENGRFGSVSINMGWCVAEAYTEEEWHRETADWEERVIALEGERFTLDINVDHFSGCIPVMNRAIQGFRSEARSAIGFEAMAQLQSESGDKDGIHRAGKLALLRPTLSKQPD